MLWLIQAVGGTCDYGILPAHPHRKAVRSVLAREHGSCGGCYLPSGISGIPCPASSALAHEAITRGEAGSLAGIN